MMRPLRICSLFVSLVVLGCGGPGDVDPNLVPVSGTVTVAGQPLKQGVIQFVYQDGVRIFSGNIVDGQYQLHASQSGEGALPGKYRVSVRAWKTEPAMDAEGNFVEGEPAIAEIYFEPPTSGLEAEVPEGGGKIDFDLKAP